MLEASGDLLRADWPGEKRQRELTEAYSGVYPEAYRLWCRSVVVPAAGRGLVGWEGEPWHGEFDAAIAARQDVYVVKERDVRYTTEQMLRSLWMLEWCADAALIYLTVDEAAAFDDVDAFQPRMEKIYRALPAWQQAACPVVVGPEGKFGTSGKVKIDHKWLMGATYPSTLKIAAATENVGAADAYTHGIFDECHRWLNPDLTLESVRDSVRRTGGHFVAGGSLTTKNRAGQRFLAMAQAARDGRLPGAKAMFMGWGVRQGETPERYAVLEQEARASGRQAVFALKRSHPRTWEEAVSGQEGGLADLEALLDCREEAPVVPVPEALRSWARLGDLMIWKLPRYEGAYCYGIDPSGGRGGDPGALWVFDARTREQVLVFRSRWAGYQTLADLAWALHQEGYCVYKGRAVLERSGGLVPEANNEALMQALTGRDRFSDDYFYVRHKTPTPNNPDGATPNYGFWTTGASKTVLLDEFAAAIDRRQFRYHDGFLIVENAYWRRTGDKWDFVNENDVDAGHGDVTFAGALAWQGVLAIGLDLERRATAKPWPPPRLYVKRAGLTLGVR